MPSEKQTKLKIEAGDFIVRGMDIEELFSDSFWKALKKEFPTLEVEHICFTLTSNERLSIAYERSKKDYFVVGAYPTSENISQRFLKILEELKNK